jgi:hypothetical protein
MRLREVYPSWRELKSLPDYDTMVKETSTYSRRDAPHPVVVTSWKMLPLEPLGPLGILGSYMMDRRAKLYALVVASADELPVVRNEGCANLITPGTSKLVQPALVLRWWWGKAHRNATLFE